MMQCFGATEEGGAETDEPGERRGGVRGERGLEVRATVWMKMQHGTCDTRIKHVS